MPPGPDDVAKILAMVHEGTQALAPELAGRVSKFMVVPPQPVVNPQIGEDGTFVVARNGSHVVFFDHFNDEFAVGRMDGSKLRLEALYGDFQYAIQVIMDEAAYVP